MTLQTCLTKLMGKPITMDQLRTDAGEMVEKITHVIMMFRKLDIKVEEYVCLKVIAMVQLEEDATLSYIHERYLNCLKSFTRLHFPNEPKRAENLLKKLPAIRHAASLILESKMFYVPFLLNTPYV